MKGRITILLVLFSAFLFSQEYGNEWIDYSRSHYKFPIHENGVYRLTYEALESADVPVNDIVPSQIQLFGKQREQPIFVEDGGDDSFDAGDYIEFYAEKNDGWLDSLLYNESEEAIGNPGYSLYSDTLYYFLTWKPGSHKRFIEESDVNFSAFTSQNFVMQHSDVVFSNRYHAGLVSKIGLTSSFFVAGEGWGTQNFNGSHTDYEPLDINLSTRSPYTGSDAPDPVFHGKSSANSDADFTGSGNHHLRWEIGSSNTLLYEEIFTGYRQTNVTETFAKNLLNNGTTNVRFRIINDQGAVTDQQAVHYVSIKFAQAPVYNNQSFVDFEVLNSSNEAKVRLDIENDGFNEPVCYVFGGGVPRKIPMVLNDGKWQLLIPNASNSDRQRVVITNKQNVENVNIIKPVASDAQFMNFENASFDKSFIIVYHKKFSEVASEYASYRASQAGGAYNVIAVEASELYDQFGAGIRKHILGIRRLAALAFDSSLEKPKGLLLLGKGIREANPPKTASNSGARKNFSSYTNNLIPSFGYPSSDICIVNRIDGTESWAPNIPVGRVAAKNEAELRGYLEKLKVYEGQQDQSSVYNKETKEWQKEILHFGGGADNKEQTLFKNYLNSYKNKIEGAKFGGNVTSFFKETSDPFNPVQNTIVTDRVEDGVSMMTFFGHATGNDFDQSIDDPANWNNTGKYPFVLGNSCYTGNIFQPSSTSASERFVLIQDLGAIGFMSSTELGVAQTLNFYSSELYNQFSYKNYGEPLGFQIAEAIKNTQGNFTSLMRETTVTQMTLHCDPGVRLNWHGLPEIDLTRQDISFTPTEFDLSTDSLSVHVVLTNLGQSITDTFSLEVRRNFPDSPIDSIYRTSVSELHFKDTFVFTLPVQQEIGLGMNNFHIQADIPSFIEEIYEEYENNQVYVDLFVDVQGIVPILPYNYAVVPNDSVVVKASTINPIATMNSYRFEIDTTDLFNSPFRKYAQISGLGGVKEVFPDEWRNVSSNAVSPLEPEDSMVYFWRVGLDSVSPTWFEHSFQYIEGKEGWGQDHFFQFKNGGFTGIEYDRDKRRRNFELIEGSIGCEVYDNAGSQFTFNGTRWLLNGLEAEYGICTENPSLHVAVVDPSTLEPWGTYNDGVNEENQFGNVNNGSGCRNRVENYFIFRQNSAAQLQAFENMILNEVPDGHYILVYTARFAQFDNWESMYDNLFSTMQFLGSDSIVRDRENRAFIFMARKGYPSTAKEIFAQNANDFITLSMEIENDPSKGVERSTIIGPAAKWNTLFWKQNPLEDPTSDKTILKIRALDKNRQLQFTIDTTFTRNDSIPNLNNLISADEYPYLQLQAEYKDSVDLTPAQVQRWHVLYDPLPEAAIDGTTQYTFKPVSKDSLREGQDVSFAVDVKNIGHLPMDSMLIHYFVIDRNQNIVPIPYERQDSLLPGEVLRDTVTFSTRGLVGSNVLLMEVNPFLNGVKDQPELAHFNNILQLPFFVEEDDINPLLDVTFDGIHILNGDIVNPNAEIVITLKDNNPFLVMDEDQDTSRFGIFLTNPEGIQKRVPFINGNGQQVMQWIPADGENLKFKIIYPARLEEEGEYELLVQGSDKSENLSGDLEYRVKFDVVLGSSITHMMNYPNPFSTQTKFVFTLTGSEVPDELKIQIMTITGRVVREITQDQIGPIRIGRNITEYAWDGRDEFGDRLANGVYIYRMIAKINGENIEHRSSGADQHFKRNWGKMYLMR